MDAPKTKKRGRPPIWTGEDTAVVALLVPRQVALAMDELVLRAKRAAPGRHHSKGSVVADLVRAAATQAP